MDLCSGSAGIGLAFHEVVPRFIAVFISEPTALRPAASDLVLLADASFVLEPNLYCLDVDRLLTRDFIQARGEVFLKSSITPSAWAWWRGRADSLR